MIYHFQYFHLYSKEYKTHQMKSASTDQNEKGTSYTQTGRTFGRYRKSVCTSYRNMYKRVFPFHIDGYLYPQATKCFFVRELLEQGRYPNRLYLAKRENICELTMQYYGFHRQITSINKKMYLFSLEFWHSFFGRTFVEYICSRRRAQRQTKNRTTD